MLHTGDKSRETITSEVCVILIRGGRCLIDGDFVLSDIAAERRNACGLINLDPTGRGHALTIDARGLLVLPGVIDIHGDSFERQIMPRPGVKFGLVTAMAETDRQLAGNGITTAYHGLTWSWEPGFRGPESARAFVAALETFRRTALVDHRLHLRQEIYNIDAESEIAEWLSAGRIDLLAFNDHLTGTIKVRHRPEKMRDMIRRSGLAETDFLRLVDETAARDSSVPDSIARLASCARKARVPMMSHDDLTTADRERYRALGARIAEFPVREIVAEAAIEGGDLTVFGAPNVVRGGSHTGCPSAAEMALKGHCSMLASDYYYPSLAYAPFVLEARHGLPLQDAWRMVSAAPAEAAGLIDRGVIAKDRRADLVLVEREDRERMRVVATLSNGRLVQICAAERLQLS